jgi:hypothetical protein
MKRPRPRSNQVRQKPITAADLGVYLRNLAGLYKQTNTGNPRLAEALIKISTILSEGKGRDPGDVLRQTLETQPDLWDDLDFSQLSPPQIRKIMSDESTSKASLLILAHERLGMALSRLEKMPRDELIEKIEAALRHEESLGIIAEEASRYGSTRTS